MSDLATGGPTSWHLGPFDMAPSFFEHIPTLWYCRCSRLMYFSYQFKIRNFSKEPLLPVLETVLDIFIGSGR